MLCSFSAGDSSFSVAALLRGIETLSGDCFLMGTSWVAIELHWGVGGNAAVGSGHWGTGSDLWKGVKSVGLKVHPHGHGTGSVPALTSSPKSTH